MLKLHINAYALKFNLIFRRDVENDLEINFSEDIFICIFLVNLFMVSQMLSIGVLEKNWQSYV